MTTRGTDARRLTRAVIGMLLAAVLVHGSMPDPGRAADPLSALAAGELARQYGGRLPTTDLSTSAPPPSPTPTKRSGSASSSGSDGQSTPSHASRTAAWVAARSPPTARALPSRDSPARRKGRRRAPSRVAEARMTEQVPAAVWITADVSAAVERVEPRTQEVENTAGHCSAASRRPGHASRATRPAPAPTRPPRRSWRRRCEGLGGSVGYASPSAPIASSTCRHLWSTSLPPSPSSRSVSSERDRR